MPSSGREQARHVPCPSKLWMSSRSVPNHPTWLTFLEFPVLMRKGKIEQECRVDYKPMRNVCTEASWAGLCLNASTRLGGVDGR